MSFDALGLGNELVQAVTEQGYTTPTPIQAEAIPVVLSQRDVMAVANTGTGKTAAFTLPLLQLLSTGTAAQTKSVRALIITPTRELAAQVAKSVQQYSCHLAIRSAAVFGGVRIEPQIAQLADGIDLLVATPGRLIDLYNQDALCFDELDVLVLDEADRMLDLGFIDDIKRIQTLLPKKRQTLLFSATFSDEIKMLTEGMLNDPQMVEASPVNSTVDTVKQTLYTVDKSKKGDVLIYLLKKYKWRQVLVFSRTKQGADTLVEQLNQVGINSASIHANRTQHARTHALDGFKNGDIRVLVATDIASRGIDVHQLPCVINVDLPYVPEDYVHRIGRTGRAGTAGLAISLFSSNETKQLNAIERLLNRTLLREIIPQFAPTPPSKKTSKHDDDEYGNFEPTPDPRRSKGKSQKRKGKR
ncbi:DEAD/DEAH box helicase [Pseudoalteromonas ulvae]|uniref:DEAD-box ATP-dependent RNA helicase RhpA n=1 Tax=Pseudoalteromonas ulvae TaxID=107327 RepID=A0A244CMR0_PSEDV|nr:DEAD/DEAH box helicase [Pseudoalteromonas ulvae]OUL56875.1 ATP-dependent RNA helicase RhlE [Pseudoalteromonas ulvae]